MSTIYNNDQPSNVVAVKAQQPTLADGILSLALKNQDAGLIIANGIAISIVLFVISRSVIELIKTLRTTK